MQSLHILLALLFFSSTPLVFADDGKPIHVNILDSYSEITLETSFTIDSVRIQNIVSEIQNRFDFQYDQLESLVAVDYGASTNFIEKSTTIATSSNCQTEVKSRHTFTVDATDIDSIFLEIITSDRLSKTSLTKSLILQSHDPENWSITAVTEDGETKVQFLHCGERLTNFIPSANQQEILAQIITTTGLSESEISEIWDYVDKDFKEEIDFQTNEELIEGSLQIIRDAENQQAKLEQTIDETQTGTGPGLLDGGCLIATATYDTELAPQVQLLREIRDTKLLTTNSGSGFMSGFNQLYYSFSPTIADWERENPIFKELVKITITPMLSTLSIMTLAEDGSESQVLAAGMSVISLNLGLYFALPAVVIYKIRKTCLK